MTGNKQKRAGRRLNLFRWTLLGLPELGLFETDLQRQQALDEIARESSDLAEAGWWQRFLILAPSVIMFYLLLRFFRSLVAWLPLLEEALTVGLLVTVAGIVFRWPHQSEAS